MQVQGKPKARKTLSAFVRVCLWLIPLKTEAVGTGMTKKMGLG